MPHKGRTQNTMSTPLLLPDRSPPDPQKNPETSDANDDSNLPKIEGSGGAPQARPPSTYRNQEEGAALDEGERPSKPELANSPNSVSAGENDAFLAAQMALSAAQKGYPLDP